MLARLCVFSARGEWMFLPEWKQSQEKKMPPRCADLFVQCVRRTEGLRHTDGNGFNHEKTPATVHTKTSSCCSTRPLRPVGRAIRSRDADGSVRRAGTR